MNIKSLLLGSAAALVAVTGARAADAVVIAEPEPMDYVRICDTYGVGFYYIPGTETCLRISGYMQYDIRGGELLDQISNTGEETWYKRSRFQLRVDARSETELGTLRGYFAGNMDYVTGSSTTQTFADVAPVGTVTPADFTTTRVFDANDGLAIDHLYIEIAGFLIGKTDSLYSVMTGYAGNVLTDGQVSYGPFQTNTIRYTWAGGNGFSISAAVEEGDEDEGGTGIIDDYMPHVVAGAAYTQAWGGISAVVGYDANAEEVAGKVRVDVNVSDTISLFAMGGWQSDADSGPTNIYAQWGNGGDSDWAAWVGGSVKLSDATSINAELDFDDDRFGAAVNVIHDIVPGLTATAEVAYFDNDSPTDDGEFGGRLRLRRSF